MEGKRHHPALDVPEGSFGINFLIFTAVSWEVALYADYSVSGPLLCSIPTCKEDSLVKGEDHSILQGNPLKLRK